MSQSREQCGSTSGSPCRMQAISSGRCSHSVSPWPRLCSLERCSQWWPGSGVEGYAYVPERPPHGGDSPRGSQGSAHDLPGPHAQNVVVYLKSNLNPSQELIYIGALLPMEGLTLLPVDRNEALTRALLSFKRVGALHSTHLWMQILGLMAQ